MASPVTFREPSGLLLLNKAPGLTSFQSLNGVKKALATPKVGHTGTLDKFASGLLVVLAGRAVKLTPWFSGCDKQYEGTIRFGVETDTLDPEGLPVAQGEIPSKEALEAVLPRFRGDILQAPPAYSAIHLGGQRASRLAREGKPVEMKERPVTVYALELRSYEPPRACIHVHCSRGTYIRSLARDIALAAGSRGHLEALTRTRVAGFSLSGALELSASTPAEELLGALKPLSPGIFERLGLPAVLVDDAAAESIVRGVPLERLIQEKKVLPPENADALAAGLFRSAAALSGEGGFLGIIEQKSGERTGERTGGRWSYGYVYART
ncbi:MAG: tRNA pseudouridine(55) synthase TruB [Spirochaetaceae bacterium]|jgi:tRNA pseudouridine55 synthase|nr:tRNA pseudouridine(55) synthase TruB [Spirochaetaceae bacterium]